MTHDIVFWGATGQARVLAELIEGTPFRLVALIDRKDLHSPFADTPLLVGMAALDQWLAQRPPGAGLHGAVAIGGGHGQDRIAIRLALEARGIGMPVLIHRTAFVAANAAVGSGSQILAGSTVCAAAAIGRSVIINTAASVDHDCVVEDGAHIGPGAVLAGEVRVGARAFIGAGAILLPRIQIATDAVVGAGAVVTRDVPTGAVVVGNPARIKAD